MDTTYGKITSFLETLVISVIGGILFSQLHIPLAWLLGPMTTVMVWKMVTNRVLFWPLSFRNIGLMGLGYLLGVSFTRETLVQVASHLPTMLVATVLVILFSFLMGYILTRTCKISLMTGMIGSVPGGLSQMVMLGEELRGVDSTVVTFMQTLRLLSVIFLVPFLVGHGLDADLGSTVPLSESNQVTGMNFWVVLTFILAVVIGVWIGKKISLPTAPLLGPLLATSVLVLVGVPAPELPEPALLLSQVLVGAHMGIGMNTGSLSNWKTLAPFSIAASVAVVFFTLGIASVLVYWHPMSLVNAFLCTSPGGVAEMGVTAKEVKVDLSIVTAYQLFRMFFILFLIPPLIKWWANRISVAQVLEGVPKVGKTDF
ncbi:AbrB family transcriptional regulator [Ammoniphilus sp. CFH 90114]|uniref:AbrB family transcriptional regulator n=1 Tax=Ammoniphilus sp. CFH 90114 TaxID=2493665 RepID=UPI00100FBBF1|nr:AbrB family transcriptional regulator [Ammoniphilus sp. CFH 90114]RXT02316.1 AbrB family transcriptional regulator [Ammoniphilus sp. CFH 90114]